MAATGSRELPASNPSTNRKWGETVRSRKSVPSGILPPARLCLPKVLPRALAGVQIQEWMGDILVQATTLWFGTTLKPICRLRRLYSRQGFLG